MIKKIIFLNCRIFIFLLISMLIEGCARYVDPRKSTENFNHIFNLVKQKNFFEARDFFFDNQESFSQYHLHLSKAFIDNAFNKLEDSEENIDIILKDFGEQLPDSISFELYQLKQQNLSKLFDYKEAKNTIETLLSNFPGLLDSASTGNYKNTLKIWSALESNPPQQVIITDDVDIALTRDKAGLKNLPVSIKDYHQDFIFDTGANISTTIRSVAERYMEILPAEIEVGTITGKSVKAGLAVCPVMEIGSIKILNSVFLVLEDEDLSFPQADYYISGIIGFPIFEALKEIQITKDDRFIVNAGESQWEGKPNLALNNLQLLIKLDGGYYILDTGADHSILFKKYFDSHKKQIEENYTKSGIKFGGAGGAQSFEGYFIQFAPTMNESQLFIDSIAVLTEDIKDSWSYYYGNIGQDLISRFDKMTLNFHHMYVKFE